MCQKACASDSLKMLDKVIKIIIIGKNQTVYFAGSELMKYLEKMISCNTKFCLQQMNNYDPTLEDSLWLGLFNDFGLESDVDEIQFDDAVNVSVKSGCGIIAGVNPRSVLLACYRFLTEVGCRWVRPGADGEYIPKKGIWDLNVKLNEEASYRHRGICIEGAVSYENVADIIDWAPKVGFNTYFIQFEEAAIFFDRWYSHRENPLKEPESFLPDQAKKFMVKLIEEIKKRSLLYHAVGHGWTCKALGISSLGWDKVEYDIPTKFELFVAEVGGKRALWGGVPPNTQLCYSNPEARSIVANSIMQYLIEHEEVDVLHFWLADGSNNHCECENCKEKNPSDYYVMMLNELDTILTSKGINAKIVFLIYVDLLWVPQSESIKNPSRFILMFAPITRTYSCSFKPSATPGILLPYERNKLKMPSSVEENVAFLRAWQSNFKGDSFDFDYHLMWDHYNDPGHISISKIINEDIKGLRDISLNGYISCQVQRAFFPTGLPMYIMGKTLWDDKTDFEAVAPDYFNSAFGEDGTLCRLYLSKLSELFDPPYLRGEKAQNNEESAKRFDSIPDVIHGMLPIIERNICSSNVCHRKSWKYLKYHAEICCLMADMFKSIALDNKDRAKESCIKLKEYVRRNEDVLQRVLDVFELIFIIDGKMDEIK